ncbi:MAG TPA: zinc-binding dehydrogenase [Acidimicrobiales bacterium]|nr:zinc-binding dehydrogenase [Acidimicrobiales bacterium]
MKAVVQHAFGGVDVLAYEDVEDPALGPGDVLVRVEAAALNRLDVLQRQGPPLLPGFRLPHIAGMDVAGTIVAAGELAGGRVGERVVVNPALQCGTCPACKEGDDGLCPNVRVVGGTVPGGYAELCSVPADHAFALPEGVSAEEAATIPTVFSTAWHALVTVGRLQAGETLLVHGAGSGVTIAAIQLAKRLGARVVASATSERKLELARELGADVVVNNRTGDVVAACREATEGRGADIALDHVGPALFQATIEALRPRGRLAFCGTTTGELATFNLPYAYHFGISLLGVDPYRATEFADMLAFYWGAGFVPVIDSTFPLAQAADAQRRMESGEAAGKILLLP